MRLFRAFLKLCCGAVLISVLFALPVQATEETKNKLNQAQNEKTEKEDQLNDTKNQITTMNQEKDSLTGTLHQLNNQLSEVSNNLGELEEDIDEKQGEIDVTLEEIEDTKAKVADAKATVEDQYETMKKQFRFIYERGDSLYLELLFSSGTFGSALNKADYMEQLSRYQKKMLEQYRQAQADLEEQQRLLEEQQVKLEEEQAQLNEYHAKVSAEQSKISGMVSSTSSSIKSYANQISQAEADAKTYEEEIRQKEQEIAELKKQLAEEERMIQLAAASSWRDLSEITFAENDRYLLANLIYCEAGGEPYIGKVAVGAVVMNRLMSSVYPDTMVGVIYQNKQFSPVASGRLALALAENRATQACYEAADAAMSVTTPVSNCLYFRTPIEQVTPRYTIGGHIFY